MKKVKSQKTFFVSRYFLIFMLSWCNLLSLIGQNIFNLPEIIPIEKDKENIKVHTILQDSLNFLWLATSNGLYRYDGQIFTAFPNLAAESNYRTENSIMDIYLENSETMWVGSRSGLFTFNIKNHQFKKFTHPLYDEYKDKMVRFIKPLGDSILLYSVDFEGLFIYHLKKDSLEQLKFNKGYTDIYLDNPARRNRIAAIYPDIKNDSIIWLGSLEGLIKLNIFTHSSEVFINKKDTKKYTIYSNNIRDIFQLNSGKILLGTWGGGLNTFHPKTEKFEEPLHKKKQTGAMLSLHAFMPLEDNKIYCLTGGANFVFDYQKETITQTIEFPSEIAIQPHAYFKDNTGRYWANFSSQLGKIDALAQQFNHFTLQKNFTTNRENQVRDFSQFNKNGDIIITADFSSGVFILNRKNKKIKKIPIASSFRPATVPLRSWGMVKTPQEEWIILDYDGLFTFSSDGKNLVPYRIQLPNTGAEYRSILLDSRGYLWVGSQYGGLARCFLGTGETKVFYDEFFPQRTPIKATAINSIYEDTRGNIWVKRFHGYSVYDIRKDSIYNFIYDINPEKSFIHVDGFVEDDKGIIWVGGDDSFGMINVNFPEKGVIKKITFPELNTHTPSNLTKVDNGDIWFITSDGVFIFDPDSLQIKVVDNFYGYGKKETFSFSKLSTGEIAIGYRNNIKIFHPDSIKFNTEIPKPYIANLKINSVTLNDSLLLGNKKISLHHSENTLSFQISAIAYTASKAVRFLIKMQGADENWVALEREQHIASYYLLSPGDYAFQVKAANNEGIWSEPYTLEIKIAFPWWQTIWFYLLLILTASSVIFLIFHSQLRRKLIEQKSLQLREKTELQNKLITNITHEFRTPLTIIEGMADEIVEAPLSSPQKKAGLIKKNSQRLLQLVNQMMELAKLENKILVTNWVQDDIIPFLAYMTDAFSSLAADKKISLQFYAETPVLTMDFDPEKLKKIVTNLLSNAIKFTPEYGKILVTATKVNSNLQIKVIDSGVGISQEHIAQIFSRFYRADESGNVAGSGIGLAIAKELTDLLNGQVYVESEKGKGSTFFVELPIKNQISKHKAQPLIVPPEDHLFKMPQSLQRNTAPLFKPSDKPIALIVEDNADLIYYLKNCLSSSYDILIGKNGVEGIELAFSSIPDIIISDVMMPVKDGFELCKTLKEDTRTSHIPIILLTAKVDKESKLKGLKKGADAYLSKPFSKEELLLRMLKLRELREQLKIQYGNIPILINKQSTAISKEDEFIIQLNSVIDENLSKADFATTLLCSKMKMSRPQLYRKIKALTGMSTSIYIRKYRLRHAHQWLETTDKRISEIAFDCGFDSTSWFTQAFKKEFGYTPSKVRR